jgi:hypothetical protein
VTNPTKLAWGFAAVFIAVGLLGLVPGLDIGAGPAGSMLVLGPFSVHDTVHLASGLIAAAAATAGGVVTRLYFGVFGVLYGLIAVAGIAPGLITVNILGNLLHVALAVGAAWVLLRKSRHRLREST